MIRSFASARLRNAKDVADRVIKLSDQRSEHHQRMVKATALSDIPWVSDLDLGYGLKAWAAILSVDLADSSNRALRVGARDTYIIMHTLLPTLAVFAGKKGRVAGLRGDGLFAAYGLTRTVDGSNTVTGEMANNAVGDAARTAQAMIEAAQDVLNPLLKANGVSDGVTVHGGSRSGSAHVFHPA